MHKVTFQGKIYVVFPDEQLENKTNYIARHLTRRNPGVVVTEFFRRGYQQKLIFVVH